MRQLVEKENSEFKPVRLRFKIDLVSNPVRAEVLVNMYKEKVKERGRKEVCMSVLDVQL